MRGISPLIFLAVGTAAHPKALSCYHDGKTNKMAVGQKIMGYPVNAWTAGPSIRVSRSLPGQQTADEYVPGEAIEIVIADLSQSNTSAPTFIAVRVSDTATGAGRGKFVALSAGFNWTSDLDSPQRRPLRDAADADADADADAWKCPFQFFTVVPDAGAGAPPTQAMATWIAPPCSASEPGASITVTVLFGAGSIQPAGGQFVGYVNATTKVIKRSSTYDCVQALANDFGLAWKLNTAKNSLNAMLTYAGDPTGTAWIGVGMSDDNGAMVASTNSTINTAIIANVSVDGTERYIGAYELIATSITGVVKAANYPLLVDKKSGFDSKGNVSYLSFQQRTDMKSMKGFNQFGKSNNIIFAAGNPVGGDIGQHKVANKTRITWSPPPPSPPPPSPPPPSPPPSPPSTCTCCTSWCTKSGKFTPDQGAPQPATATDWTLSWRVTERVTESQDRIDFAVEINAAAWVGFGIPSSAMNMVGAYAVLCKPGSTDEDAVGEYYLNDYSPGSFVPMKSELLSADLTQQTRASGPARTICQFRRNVTTATAHSQNFSAANSFIIAAGGSNTFQQHASYFHDPKVGKIDWRTGGSSASAGGVSLTSFQQSVVYHAVLMVLSWGLLIPTGVLAARYRGVSGTWFKIHRAANSLGLVAGFVGLGIIVSASTTAKRPHFVVTHAKIGLAVMVICGFQPLNAFVRPSKRKEDAPSLGRLLWELCHKGSGYLAVVLAWVNIVLAGGLAVMQDDALAHTKSTAELAFYLLLGGLCCTAVVTALRQWLGSRADGNIQRSGSNYEGM